MSGVEELSGENRALLEKHFGAFWGTIFYTSGPAMRTAINDLLNAARNQAPTPSVGTSRDWTPTPEAQTEAVVWLRNWCDRRFYKLIVHNTARLAIGALVEILAGRCDHSGDAQPIFAPSGEGLNRAQGHALTASGEMAAALKSVADEIFERWDKDMRSGKLLTALAGRLPGYDPRTDAILAALALPPAGIEGSVGEAVAMTGSNGGFSMVVFKASDVPIGTKLYAHPPQDQGQVSAQDGSALERGTADTDGGAS